MLADDVPEGVVIQDRPGYQRHITGGGVLAFCWQTAGVFELGVPHPQLLGAPGHPDGEVALTASAGVGHAAGSIIATLDQSGLQERFQGILLAGFEIHFVRLGRGVVGGNGGDAVERSAFHADEGGNEFLRAGDGPALIRIFLKKNLSPDGIHDEAGFRDSGRRRWQGGGRGGDPGQEQCGECEGSLLEQRSALHVAEDFLGEGLEFLVAGLRGSFLSSFTGTGAAF